LTDQRTTASILNKFDALVNDPGIGLPAEHFARRKQYEYYRDRLLTFKELAA
jgi:type I restriction enzyme S subunit